MCTLANKADIQLYTMPRLVRAILAIHNSGRQLRYFDAYWNQIRNRLIELGELSP